MTRPAVPRVVRVYGLLGLIPFLAPPLIGLWRPEYKLLAASVLALYGALILSFLGGARWGMTVLRPAPDAVTVSLAMLPSLAGLALVLMPDSVRLLGLAAALALHWFWDIRSPGMPSWYSILRSVLTAGAVLGLLAGRLTLT